MIKKVTVNDLRRSKLNNIGRVFYFDRLPVVTENTKKQLGIVLQDGKYQWDEIRIHKKFEEIITRLQKEPFDHWTFVEFKEYLLCADKFGIDVEKYEDFLTEFTEKDWLDKIENKLKELNENITNHTKLGYLMSYITEAEELWIDIKKYKDLLPEIREKHYVAKIEEEIQDVYKNPLDDISFSWLESYIREAKELWIDISKYKEKFVNIAEKHYSASLEDLIITLQKKPGNALYFSEMNKKLESAKKNWIDVSKYEKLFPEIENKYYLVSLEKNLESLKKDPKDEFTLKSYAFDLEQVIQRWIDVSKYKQEFPEITKNIYQKILNNFDIRSFERFYMLDLKEYYISDLEKYKKNIEEAEEVWVDVSEYKEFLHRITIKKILKKLQHTADLLKQFPWSKEALDDFHELLKSAKKAGADVTEFETSIPKIIENYYLIELENHFNKLQRNPKDSYQIIIFKSLLESAQEAWVDVKPYQDLFNALKKD